MQCRLCDNEGEGCRAHILPEAFYRNIRGEDDRLLLLGTDPDAYARRAPIGIYDTELVCRSCERTFNDWDRFGADFLLRRLQVEGEELRSLQDGRVIGHVYAPPPDYASLSLFVLSVLWRASASGRDFYQRVDLGPLQNVLREMIRAGDPGEGGRFGFVLSRWITRMPDARAAHAPMSPFCELLDGVNMVRLYLGPAVASVKADQRPFPPAFRRLVFRRDAPLIMPAREFESSRDFQVFAEALARLR